MNRNRDYFERPQQNGGRDGHDYGRSNLAPEPGPHWAPWIILAAILLWTLIGGLFIHAVMG